jgi:uncharacterized protein (TIGR00730 family)
VNGGGKFGVMGALNEGCRQNKGQIIGVIHEKFVFDSEEDEAVTKLIACTGNDLNERKKQLFNNGDCIVVAPGGVGTLDEMWDSVCGKSLKMNGLAHKPICVLNIDGFFNGSIAQLQQAYKDQLLYSEPEAYFHVAESAAEALDWCIQEVSHQRSHPEDSNDEEQHRIKERTHKLATSDITYINSSKNRKNDVSKIMLPLVMASFLTGVVVGVIAVVPFDNKEILSLMIKKNR